MRKQDKSAEIEKTIVDTFLKKGYFYTDSLCKISELQRHNIIKALPNNVLCTTVVSNICGNFVILDVARIENIVKEDDVYHITMKDNHLQFPFLFPAASFSTITISGVLKRLKRFDILLQIEG
jgi:hypothetical protein